MERHIGCRARQRRQVELPTQSNGVSLGIGSTRCCHGSPREARQRTCPLCQTKQRNLSLLRRQKARKNFDVLGVVTEHFLNNVRVKNLAQRGVKNTDPSANNLRQWGTLLGLFFRNSLLQVSCPTTRGTNKPPRVFRQGRSGSRRFFAGNRQAPFLDSKRKTSDLCL